MTVEALWTLTGVVSTRPQEQNTAIVLLCDGRMIAANSGAHWVGTYRHEGRKLFFRCFRTAHDPPHACDSGLDASPCEATGLGVIAADGRSIDYAVQIVDRPEVTISGMLERIAEIPNFRRVSSRARLGGGGFHARH